MVIYFLNSPKSDLAEGNLDVTLARRRMRQSLRASSTAIYEPSLHQESE